VDKVFSVNEIIRKNEYEKLLDIDGAVYLRKYNKKAKVWVILRFTDKNSGSEIKSNIIQILKANDLGYIADKA